MLRHFLVLHNPFKANLDMLGLSRREFLGTVAAGLTVGSQKNIENGGSKKKRGVIYVDWSWEKWKSITVASPSRIESEQVGHEELVDLLPSNGKTIKTIDQWVKKRKEIKRTIEGILV